MGIETCADSSHAGSGEAGDAVATEVEIDPVPSSAPKTPASRPAEAPPPPSACSSKEVEAAQCERDPPKKPGPDDDGTSSDGGKICSSPGKATHVYMNDTDTILFHGRKEHTVLQTQTNVHEDQFILDRIRKRIVVALYNMTPHQLMAAAPVLLITLNLIFASLYSAIGGCCGEDNNYEENFHFSVQVLSTIGFGSLSPVGSGSDFTVLVEFIAVTMVLVLFNGFIFLKTIKANFAETVLWPAVICVHSLPGEKYPVLSLRLLNLEGTSRKLLKCEMSLWLVNQDTGSWMTLDLRETRQCPWFCGTWQVYHIINEHSPLFGLSPEALSENLYLWCFLRGEESAVSSTETIIEVYNLSEEMLWGRRFSNAKISQTNNGSKSITTCYSVQRALCSEPTYLAFPKDWSQTNRDTDAIHEALPPRMISNTELATAVAVYEADEAKAENHDDSSTSTFGSSVGHGHGLHTRPSVHKKTTLVRQWTTL